MLNINQIKKIYFVGIKGVGMTSLAIFAKQLGKVIAGSDISENFVTNELLSKNKIKVLTGFSKQNIIDFQPDLVIATGAHEGLQNEEVIQAQKMKIPVFLQGEAVGYFANSTGQKQIAVAGSHGKTTTSAMISHVLAKSGYDPSFLIGAEINSLKTSGQFGKDDYFVIEADEYVADSKLKRTPKFLYLKPDIAVILNVDLDHVDIFKNMQAIKKAFADFAKKTNKNGLLITCADDKESKDAFKKIAVNKMTYGYTENANLKVTKYSFERQTTKFELVLNEKNLGEFRLQIPGKQNIQNASAAILTCLQLGLSLEKIKKSISSYQGTKRRFEKVFENSKFTLYDDYAHHPEEIKKTLEAAKKWFPKKRIIAVFQPHTYSRTKALLERFSKCFSQADVVIISDIYASLREKNDPQISSEILAKNIKKYHKNVIYGGKIDNTAKITKKNIKEGDLVITMGAGDIFQIHDKLT